MPEWMPTQGFLWPWEQLFILLILVSPFLQILHVIRFIIMLNWVNFSLGSQLNNEKNYEFLSWMYPVLSSVENEVI